MHNVSMQKDSVYSFRDPILKQVDIDQNTIDRSVTDLVNYLAKYRFQILNTVTEEKKAPENFRFIKSAEQDSPHLSLNFCGDENIVNKNLSGEECYCAQLNYDINNVTQTSILGPLILKLKQEINKQGLKVNYVKVRFEKGCISPLAPFWHQDGGGGGFKTSVIVNFSTKDQWSTYCISDKKTNELYLKRKDKFNRKQMFNKLDPNSAPLSHGCLYNAKDFLHRSPTEKDLQDVELDQNDYRLFFQFTKQDFGI